MRSKILLTTSGGLLLTLGFAGTFLPVEIAEAAGLAPAASAAVLFQLLAAACLGIGFLNWTARGSRLGGIYARPVVMANVVFWSVGGLALVKMALRAGEVELASVGVVALAFAAIFGKLLITGPFDPE